jgi:trehalose 6-phosphate phosphatase
LQRLEPAPRILDGKLVFNALPPGGRTKLEALSELAARIGARDVLFIGDDVTDEVVFARAPAHWLTVRVELKHGSRARFFVHRQAEVAILLEVLVRRAQQARNDQAVA